MNEKWLPVSNQVLSMAGQHKDGHAMKTGICHLRHGYIHQRHRMFLRHQPSLITMDQKEKPSLKRNTRYATCAFNDSRYWSCPDLAERDASRVVTKVAASDGNRGTG